MGGALMRGTQRAQLERLRRDATVLVKDVAVGDVVEFIGTGKRAGTRLGEVYKVHPRLKVVRVRWVLRSGKVLWRAAIHETRIVANHGPRKRVV